MKKKQTVEKMCTLIYEGNINDVMLLLKQQPELINSKSPKHDNKTLLMCALNGLKNAAYLSLEQQDLSKLINSIMQNPALDLKTTDDFGNSIFHLAFKYARSTDNELSKEFFDIGEKFLRLIQDEYTLKKIINKKTKSSCKKSQKIFLQYVFPNLQEENLSEQEIEHLKHIQKRIIYTLIKIFNFKDLARSILTDPICEQIIITPFIFPATGITLSWDSWLKIIDNPLSVSQKIIKTSTKNLKLVKQDLIYNPIVESLIKIYHDNSKDEQTLIAKYQDYLIINEKMIQQAILAVEPDLVLYNMKDLIEKFRKYTNYINKLTPNKLGLQYDKNKH